VRAALAHYGRFIDGIQKGLRSAPAKAAKAAEELSWLAYHLRAAQAGSVVPFGPDLPDGAGMMTFDELKAKVSPKVAVKLGKP